MTKMTAQEIESAKIAARAAVEFDRRHDCAARDRAMRDLFVAAGYWRQERDLSTAAFRGERVPPKMIRMPAGRSVEWSSKRFAAAEAWAQAAE